jgi:hypothetical protein
MLDGGDTAGDMREDLGLECLVVDGGGRMCIQPVLGLIGFSQRLFELETERSELLLVTRYEGLHQFHGNHIHDAGLGGPAPCRGVLRHDHAPCPSRGATWAGR